MFNSIRGTVTEKLSESLRLLTAGIEWDIAVPATDLPRLGLPGGETVVYVWLYHREDQMRLFGFADETRRGTFHELMKVEGIGPRQALKIMGGIGQEELERALDAEDLARLEAVPGLGKKTAQKMILALKGKLARDRGPAAAALPGAHQELVDALAGMGYDRKAAAEAVAKAEAALSASGAALSPAGADREKLIFKQAILSLSGM